MKKILLILAAILLLLILAIAGITGYATSTEKGMTQVLSLAQKYSPGELKWDVAKGQLTGPLELQKLSYQQKDGLTIKMTSTEFDWEPKQLFSKRLKINKLTASDIEIHLPAAKEKEQPEEPFSLPDIQLPVDLDIRSLDLDNIKVFPHGAEKPIVIERLKLAAAAEGSTVQLLDFKLQSPEADASVTGTLQPRDNYPMDIALNWVYRHAEFGEINGDGTISGDFSNIHLDHSIKGLAHADIKADLHNALNDLSWDADIDLNIEQPQKLSDQLNSVPLTATIHSSGKVSGFSANGKLNTSAVQSGPVALNFELQGDTKKINFEKLLVDLIDRPGELSLQGNVVLETQHAELQGSWKQLGWPIISEPEYLSEKGAFKFNGSAKDYQLTLDTDLDGEQLLPLTASITAKGSDKAFEFSSLSIKAKESPLTITAKGDFEFKEQKFNLDGGWKSVQWPMQDEADYESPTGTFNVSGKVSDYKFELSTDLLGKSIPKGQWQLAGNGSDKALSDFKLLGKTLGGTIESSGKASWNPSVDWDVQLSGNGINPGEQWPEANGKIDLQLTSKGKLTEDGPVLTADIAKLAGKLKGQPVNGHGVVSVAGTNLDLKDLNISSGDSRLKLNGKLGDKWDVKWALNAKDLAQLLPDYKGSISGKGTLKGTKEKPRASFKLNVDNFVGAGAKVSSLQGNGTIDVSGKNASNIKLTAKTLYLAGQKWDKLVLNGSGTPANHNLEINLNGKIAKLTTALKGGLKDQTWSGKLSKLSANKTEFGDWKLEKPTNIKINKTSAKADNLCLFSQPTRLCATGVWNKESGAKGAIKLSELQPRRFAEFIPPTMQLNTALNGKITGSLNSDGDIDANADLALTPGVIKLEGDAEPIVVALKEGSIRATVKDNNVASEIVLNLSDTGYVHANTTITDIKKSLGLSGSLDAKIADLKAISGFAPQLQAIEGDLTADLKLSGDLKVPLFSGDISVNNFSAEIPQTATKITVPELKLSSDGNGPIKLSGLAKSGSGEMLLDGNFNPKTQAMDIRIKGDTFEVARSKALKAVISPDLIIKMDDQGMSVKGEVFVPKAHINAKGAGGEEGVVSVSSDVVVVEKGETVKSTTAASNLNLDVKVKLGHDIKVQVADFSGELRGGLSIQQTPELAPLATGMIEVVNGDYLVYGQQLKMKRGRILFGGGPVDNPKLDMNVARDVTAYDVTAGAYIRGTAQAPQLQLYSEPPMPDASILSYMILGQPPGTKGASYTLGKYLTPDLYVGYSIGLFNAINTFNLRYKLTEKLGLHAASGIANSADLIYTIER